MDGASQQTVEKVDDMGRNVLAFHRRLLEEAGLPIGWDNLFDMSPCLTETPPTLCAFAGLRLQARIVNYWSGSVSIRKRLSDWLKLIGFEVQMSSCETGRVEQIGYRCGVVAVAAVLTLCAGSGADWMPVSTVDAIAQRWIGVANAHLQFPEHPLPANGQLDQRTKMMGTEELQNVLKVFSESLVPKPRWDAKLE